MDRVQSGLLSCTSALLSSHTLYTQNDVLKLVYYFKHEYIFGLNSTSLAGFVFLLKGIAYSGEEVSLTGKTGKDGKVYVEWKTEQGKGTIYKLAPGSYMLHETTAPSGYNRAADIRFEVG